MFGYLLCAGCGEGRGGEWTEEVEWESDEKILLSFSMSSLVMAARYTTASSKVGFLC
jgi:hypothetical protein